MKKRFLTLCVASLMGLCAIADGVQSITINGETVEKVATQLSFDGDNVILTYSDGTTQTVDMGTVQIAFSATNSIGTLSTFEYKGIINGEMVVGGLPVGSSYAVYDTAGKQLFTGRVVSSETRLDVRQLRTGIYMLRIGNQVVKFVKR